MAQLGPLISLVVIIVPLLAFWAWMANDMLQSQVPTPLKGAGLWRAASPAGVPQG